MNYWTDAIAIERLQLALSVKVVILTSSGFGLYDIQYDVLPEGVVNFAPDAFVVVRYDGSHYELMEGSGGDRLFQYNEIPGPIRDRMRGIGFFAAIASVPRNMDRTPHIDPNVPAPQTEIRPAPEANRSSLGRRNARVENPTIMIDRRPWSELPKAHIAGEWRFRETIAAHYDGLS